MKNTITLPDKRILGFAEYGDLVGKPVFFFHGTPGSRFFRPADDTTREAGVRLICVDRPGYGLSTFQRMRQLLDWPIDIACLADFLGINRFTVIVHSGGGPHTLACAYALPDRITTAITISGVGPISVPRGTHGMRKLNRLGFRWGRYIPWPLMNFLTYISFHRRYKNPLRAMEEENGHRPFTDEVQINRPEVRDVCLQSEIEAFRSGMKGFSWEVHLITRPWGFSLQQIKIPVVLWHGTADDLTAVQMVHFMSREILNNKVIICEGEAHLLLFPHWKDILMQALICS